MELIIPFYSHTEQRYFVFIIPVICMYASSFIVNMYTILFVEKKSLLHMRIWFGIIIISIICFIFIVPNIKFYTTFLFTPNSKDENMIIGEWLKNNTSSDAVVMSYNPYRIGFYSHRSVVMLPYSDFSHLNLMCKHYNVQYLAITEKYKKDMNYFFEKGEFNKYFILLNRIGSSSIYKRL